MKPWPTKLRVEFCERLRCPETRYPTQMLKECLYPQARLFRWLIRIFVPSFFRPDLDAIERLGETNSWLAFRAELDGFSQNNLMRSGWVRNLLRVRLSGARAKELAECLFGPEEEEVRPPVRAVARTLQSPQPLAPALGTGLVRNRTGQA